MVIFHFQKGSKNPKGFTKENYRSKTKNQRHFFQLRKCNIRKRKTAEWGNETLLLKYNFSSLKAPFLAQRKGSLIPSPPVLWPQEHFLRSSEWDCILCFCSIPSREMCDAQGEVITVTLSPFPVSVGWGTQRFYCLLWGQPAPTGPLGSDKVTRLIPAPAHKLLKLHEITVTGGSLSDDSSVFWLPKSNFSLGAEKMVQVWFLTTVAMLWMDLKSTVAPKPTFWAFPVFVIVAGFIINLLGQHKLRPYQWLTLIEKLTLQWGITLCLVGRLDRFCDVW